MIQYKGIHSNKWCKVATSVLCQPSLQLCFVRATCSNLIFQSHVLIYYNTKKAKCHLSKYKFALKHHFVNQIST